MVVFKSDHRLPTINEDDESAWNYFVITYYDDIWEETLSFKGAA